MANPLRQHLLLPPTGLGTGRPAPGPVTEEQTRQMEGQGTHKQPLFEEEPARTRGTSPRADRGGRRSRGAAADATDTPQARPGQARSHWLSTGPGRGRGWRPVWKRPSSADRVAGSFLFYWWLLRRGGHLRQRGWRQRARSSLRCLSQESVSEGGRGQANGCSRHWLACLLRTAVLANSRRSSFLSPGRRANSCSLIGQCWRGPPPGWR